MFCLVCEMMWTMARDGSDMVEDKDAWHGRAVCGDTSSYCLFVVSPRGSSFISKITACLLSPRPFLPGLHVPLFRSEIPCRGYGQPAKSTPSF